MGIDISGRLRDLLSDLGSVDTDVGTLLTRLSAVRAGYLDELDFDLNARLGSPAGASLAADLLTIDNFVDEIETYIKHGTYGLSALDTDLGTLLTRLTAARAGYLENIDTDSLKGVPGAGPPTNVVVVGGYDGSLIRRIRTDTGGFLQAVTMTTKTTDHPSEVVGAGVWFIIVEVASGRGTLGEFHARSPDTDFEIKLTIDGTIILDKTYTQLRGIQQNSPTISAFAELDEDGDATGYYIASIRDVPYYASLKLEIKNTGGAPKTFDQLFTKYHTRS